MIGVTHLFSAYLHRVTFWTGHISLCPLSFSVERAHCVPFLPCRILGTEPGTACRSPGAPSMAGPRPWSLLQVSAAGIYYHQPLYLFPAAAKSLQSCPTLCDPIVGSPPGSPVLGILQARRLEWAAISFSNARK